MVYVPGMNLLNMALTVIQQQTVSYYKYTSRALNAVGQYVTTYATATNIVGSWQPVPKHLYPIYNLDLQKSYYTFYTSNNVIDVNRDVAGDQIVFKGRRYQVESNNDWYNLDGWKRMLCVDIGA